MGSLLDKFRKPAAPTPSMPELVEQIVWPNLLWEQVVKDAGILVERTNISGGWLVRVTQQVRNKWVFGELGGHEEPSDPIVTTTFAFDPNHVWELSEKK